MIWLGALYIAALALGLAWWLLRLLELRSGDGGLWPALLGGAAGALQGCCVCRWILMADAIGRLGTGFAGRLLSYGLPLALAASLALTAAALLHPDFRGVRSRWLAAALLAWAVPTALAEWRLRSAWGFGPADLSQAAAVPAAAAAPQMAVAVLRPTAKEPSSLEGRRSPLPEGAAAGGRTCRIERRAQAAEGLDASPRSLQKLSAYLQERGWRSVFARQALGAVRRGWLLSWDADRALEYASLRVPGRVVPDYGMALALIRAGPLTAGRFARLERLHRAAVESSAGFEDVGTAQLRFEAFAAAFARFNYEARARYWLGRVDNLWPLNDKKVEVAPLESLRDGAVSGTLLLDGRPASAVRVGLFLETTSEATKKTAFSLSLSAFPDYAGNFRFEHLGAGRYHLELQGAPEFLRGAILGSPGCIEIAESSPTARLAPILIERRGARPAAAAAHLRPQKRAGFLRPIGKR